MDHSIHRTLADTDMNGLKQRVIAALAQEGFGVLTEIDLQATLKKKLDRDIGPHVILGACNPHYAHEVLQIDPRMSTMLPCNVTLREVSVGSYEVAAIDPNIAMGALGNVAMGSAAEQVRAALDRVIKGL